MRNNCGLDVEQEGCFEMSTHLKRTLSTSDRTIKIDGAHQRGLDELCREVMELERFKSWDQQFSHFDFHKFASVVGHNV